MQHFFHEHDQRHMDIGYKPLSVSVLSGLFFILAMLLLFSCAVFIFELFYMRLTKDTEMSPIHLSPSEQSLSDIEYRNSRLSDIQKICAEFNIDRVIIQKGRFISFSIR
jgi:hypothetical protein